VDVCRKVRLAGVELAPFAGAHDLAGISDRSGPVEALAGRVAHEGVWRRVVAAYACVDVSKELVPLRDGHASLQDAQRGTLVQLTVNEGERLGHPGDASGLGPVRGEFPLIHPGDVFVSPVLRTREWLYVHGFGLAHAVPLEQREYKRFVPGVLVHRLRACWVRESPRGFLLAPGGRLEVDGRFSDIPRKNIRGTVIRPDAILASSSTSLLYRRGT
jgi:hypothetical protein